MARNRGQTPRDGVILDRRSALIHLIAVLDATTYWLLSPQPSNAASRIGRSSGKFRPRWI